MAENKSLKAAVPLEKPWSFYGENGELRGLAVSYFRVLSEELDTPITVHAVPAKRLIHGIEMGYYDLTLMFADQAQDGAVSIVAPVLKLDKVLVGLKGLDIKNRQDIEGLRMAFVRGASSGSWIDNNQRIKKITTSNYRESLWLLKQKRVDAITGSYPVLENILTKHDMSWDDLNRPYLLSCRFVLLMFSNLSKHYSQFKAVQVTALKMKKGQKWEALLREVSEVAPSMLAQHNHEKFLSY
ncbi:substrate-binding periplasmic protein [Kiloniella sp.]|uniref:substrate-binding periplasmic protein n=1 Tax=Kiloniella sp. TaxID=1938587 RepID=UPI003B021A83